MKILHILTMHQPAGLENRVFRFIKASKNNSHSILVMSRPIHKKFKEALDAKVKIKHWKYCGPVKIPGFLRRFFLKKWLKTNKFDLFISYSQLSYRPLWKSLFANIDAPAVYYEGGAAWFKSEEYKELLQRFDRYIANSRASAAMLMKKFKIEEEKIKIIHNGLPRAKFKKISEARPADREAGKFIILYLGRLVAVKGINSLIRAMKFLDDSFKLWIIGDGKQKGELLRLARDERVKEKVDFKGFSLDPDSFLKAADIMVVSSAREPMANVVLEAGAASVPVIASDIDGFPDIIENNKNGILLKPELETDSFPEVKQKDIHDLVVDTRRGRLLKPKFLEPKEIARRIEDLKNSPRQRKRLGDSLHNTVKKNFIMEDKIVEIERLLREVVNNPDK